MTDIYVYQESKLCVVDISTKATLTLRWTPNIVDVRLHDIVCGRQTLEESKSVACKG